jgi:hypothetical protein
MTRKLTILPVIAALLLTVACNSATHNITVPDAPTTVAAFDAMPLADRQVLYTTLPDTYIEPLDGEGYFGRIFLADANAIYLVDATGERTTVLPEDLCPRVLFGIRVALMPNLEIYTAIEHARRSLLAEPPIADNARQQLATLATDHPDFKPVIDSALASPLTPVRHPDVPTAISEFATRTATIVDTRINPELHLVATDHFLIYTTGPTSQDAALATHCETLYRHLLASTELPEHTTVWPAPLTIYCFATPDEYNTFIRIAMPDDSVEMLARSDGFCAGDDGLAYLVLNGADMTNAHVAERLTHEVTHAFYRQYLSDVLLPSWLDEGLAEITVTATLPGSRARMRYNEITQSMLDGGDGYFSIDVPIRRDRDYARAQAFVRHLQSDRPSQFDTFFRLLKADVNQTDAFDRGFELPPYELMVRWQESIQD